MNEDKINWMLKQPIYNKLNDIFNDEYYKKNANKIKNILQI